MDNLIPDLSTFLDDYNYPLFPDLEMKPTVFGTSVYNLQSAPPVLNNGSTIPADDTSQRRMDQFSIKLVPTSGDVCLMSADQSCDPKLSFLKSPRPVPLQSELSKVPSTNCELMQPEDMGADFDKLTPLEKAELRLKLAIERDATRSEIRIFTNRFRNEQNKAKRLALLKQLEANLSQEQIAKIKIKSKKCATDKNEKYDFIMGHMKENADKQLTKNHSLESLCNAIVHRQKVAFNDVEEEDLFLDYRRRVKSTFSSRRSRKTEKEYIRLLKIANGIAE